MTINDLVKLIPKEHHDKLIEIYLPPSENGDSYPLIEANVVVRGNFTRILLEADYE